MGRPRRDGGHQQHGLAGEGNAGALDGHKQQHRHIAVHGEQMGQPRGVEVKHLSAPYTLILIQTPSTGGQSQEYTDSKDG